MRRDACRGFGGIAGALCLAAPLAGPGKCGRIMFRFFACVYVSWAALNISVQCSAGGREAGREWKQWNWPSVLFPTEWKARENCKQSVKILFCRCSRVKRCLDISLSWISVWEVFSIAILFSWNSSFNLFTSYGMFIGVSTFWLKTF